MQSLVICAICDFFLALPACSGIIAAGLGEQNDEQKRGNSNKILSRTVGCHALSARPLDYELPKMRNGPSRLLKMCHGLPARVALAFVEHKKVGQASPYNSTELF
jgi:hypothetical protein